jgi:hypothetical protein
MKKVRGVRGVQFHDLRKGGEAYARIRPHLRTLDLLLFRGAELVSSAISHMQERMLGNGAGRFTHVGVVILGRDFPVGFPYHDRHKVYVFESTQGGSLGDGANDVDTVKQMMDTVINMV